MSSTICLKSLPSRERSQIRGGYYRAGPSGALAQGSAEARSHERIIPGSRSRPRSRSDYRHPAFPSSRAVGLRPHSLATTVPDNFAQLSLEKLAELDADKLFVITPEGQTDEQVRELLASLPLWNNLSAVKQNRVYQVASGHWINSAYNANLAILKDVLDTVEK